MDSRRVSEGCTRVAATTNGVEPTVSRVSNQKKRPDKPGVFISIEKDVLIVFTDLFH